MTRVPQRRTQAERRADTEAKLIDATIRAIVEVGYAKTTTKEICRRAGISHGGLFGRFESVFDLVLAAAAEAGRRLIARFREQFALLPDQSDLRGVLAVLRDNGRSEANAVWIELLVAARTDAELRSRFEAVRNAYAAAIGEVAAMVPELADLTPEALVTVGATVLQLFDGNAIVAAAYPVPELDDMQLTACTTMVRAYLDTAPRR
ncbi:TetR/AcrR family transcriptional regulator [Nocardia vulneris]|uniref:TetR/AcrR family transcriptional regulator n=1 Tax=Nocardia vulneris TaxID=1141657 RepID=UPI0030D21365